MRKTEASNEIVIRRIRRTEFDRVYQLLSEGFQREIEIAGFDVRRLKRMARLYSVARVFFPLFDILHVDFETILVAISEDKPVGEIHLMPRGRKIWSIDSVVVDPRFRRRGIYRHLMQEALRYVEQRHGKTIVQCVRKDNVAPLKVADELRFKAFAENVLMYLEIGDVSFADTKLDTPVRKIQSADTPRIYEMCKALDSKRLKIYETKPEDYLDSLSSRLRMRIAQIHSERLVLDSNGKIVSYADVIYTSQKEAAKLDFLHLPTGNPSRLISVFLGYLTDFLRTKNIRKVIVGLNKDWTEIIEAFRCFGFKDLASEYEMAKELVDFESHEYQS